MLKSGRSSPSSSSPLRRGVAIGLGAALAAALLFFALRSARTNEAHATPSSASSTSTSSRGAASKRSDRFEDHAETETRGQPRRRAPASAAVTAEPEGPTIDPDASTDPEVVAVVAAKGDPSTIEPLLDHLRSANPVVVAEATRELIARGAIEAIEPLARIQLEQALGGGLSVIDALGKLGGAAGAAEKARATDRLIEMLHEEKARRGPESLGNLLQIYEALGDTQDPNAALALEAELRDPSVERAPKVVVVQGLVKIGLASSRAALEAEHREQSAQRGEAGLDEEIRLELIGVIEGALKAL